MTHDAFLRMILPASGPYCLAYPFTLANVPGRTLWRNVVVKDIPTALVQIERDKGSKDTYFAVLSLDQVEVWSDTKINYKTNQPGAYQTRVGTNMAYAKSFFLDIDVGPKKPYKTREEALAALTDFIKAAMLPWPTLVSSGGGFHVYWVLTSEISTAVWKPTAVWLKQITQAYGLHADPSRIEDQTSVLRVAGTFNWKDPANPRPVTVIKVSPPTDPDVFKQAVSDALVRSGGVPAASTPKAPVSSLFGPSNLATAYDGPTPTIQEVTSACKQAKEMVRSQGRIDQTAWYQGILGTFKWVENGAHWCHEISKGSPDYDKGHTDTKLAQLEGFAPAKCSTIASVMPWKDLHCQGCPFLNDPSVPNPLVAARRTAKAPAPVLETAILGAAPETTTIPDPPPPYTRLKSGGIAKRGKNSDGEETVEVILECDLYPIKRLVDPENATEHQLWRVHLPRGEIKEFRVDAPALYDSRKFTEVISHQGIYPHKGNVPYLQDYMVAYISKLQQEADADTQVNHLGWAKEYTQFILPDKVLCEDGTIKPAALGVGAERSSEHVKRAGTLAAQVKSLEFYNDPRYIQHQFFILGGLAAPIFYMTGQHGVIVNAAGPAGASKSTALYTAASLWGEPEQYPLNGTNSGATTRARNERVSTLANLPICVDEITHMPIKEAVDLAMGITQPGHRLRLRTDGVERKSNGAYKATIMLTTANSSLHAVLATDNTAGTAGSMRVIEVDFVVPKVHEKSEADAYLRGLKQNYGHVGPEVIAWVLKNRAKVEARVHKVMAQIDTEARIASSERFWSAYVAAVIVIGEIAVAMRLVSFDIAALRYWAINTLIPHMRGVVNEEYSTPMTILSDYIEMIQGNIVVIKASHSQGATVPYVHRPPHGALLAHYDVDGGQLFVLKKGFRDFCMKWGASSRGVLNELNTLRPDPTGHPNRIITETNVRKTLGAGTEFAKTQSYCFVVNMTHPGVVDGPHPLVKAVLGGSSATVLKLVS